jgi:CRISPR-associated endonuclease/helicase Cas3
MSINGRHIIDQKLVNVAMKTESYEEAKKSFYNHYSYAELIKIVKKALEECNRFKLNLYAIPDVDANQGLFYIGFLTRMVMSALIDSDWSDAATFFDNNEDDWKKQKSLFSWELLAKRLEKNLKKFPINNRLDRLRKQISEECLLSADRKSGIYKLDVPTGGAKTLSVMRFALAHAQKYKKKRILYMAPFKSILEQTAKVYKDKLMGSDKNRDVFILEHHSDIVFEESSKNTDISADNDEYKTDLKKYLIDNWDAPIILTTLVQFLNTLFSGKKMSIRRCHKLAQSVIIIDEFQSIPSNSVSLFNLAINALTRFFGATVVLCTATQPPYQETIGKGRSAIPCIHYEDPANIVKDYSKDAAFLRTRLVDKTEKRALNVEEIKALIKERMEKLNSLLVIVNTRDAATSIYHRMIDPFIDYDIRILSNNMIPEHRRQVLDEVKEKVKTEKMLVISTQLIEAGVDISFEGVIRSLAGLDSIAQAAGRCNRNGTGKLGEVWLVRLDKDLENTERMEDIKTAQETMSALLEDYARYPEKYGNDLMSKEALEFYFKVYLEKTIKKAGYPFTYGSYEKANKLEALELLTYNRHGINAYKGMNHGKRPMHLLNQAFHTVGVNYKPIEEQGVSVLVPWGEGEEIIIKLNSDMGLFEKKRLLSEASRYSLQINNYKYCQMKEKGIIRMIQDDIPVLMRDYYTEIGLVTKDKLSSEGWKKNYMF